MITDCGSECLVPTSLCVLPLALFIAPDFDPAIHLPHSLSLSNCSIIFNCLNILMATLFRVPA